MENQTLTRQVRRAQDRATLRRLLSKKHRRGLFRVNPRKLRKAIIAEIVAQNA